MSAQARIVAVADVYDALTSDRPYRAGWHPDRTLSYLEENAGVQFDPNVVAAFVEVLKTKGEIREGEYDAVKLTQVLTDLAA